MAPFKIGYNQYVPIACCKINYDILRPLGGGQSLKARAIDFLMGGHDIVWIWPRES